MPRPQHETRPSLVSAQAWKNPPVSCSIPSSWATGRGRTDSPGSAIGSPPQQWTDSPTRRAQLMCRKGCDPERRHGCEPACLTALQACEQADQPKNSIEE